MPVCPILLLTPPPAPMPRLRPHIYQTPLPVTTNRYELNVTPRSIIPDDMYQGHIQTPPGVWGTVAFPLNRLTLTGRGQVREYQRALERAALHSIGFSVADGLAGPFQLDVAWISAVQEVIWPYMVCILQPYAWWKKEMPRMNRRECGEEMLLYNSESEEHKRQYDE